MHILHILQMSMFCMLISHILHINTKYAEQNRALLDTLRSNNNRGHVVLYATLLIGHTQHKCHMRVSSWPFVPRQSQQTNRQDMVFIRLPGISDGAFQLRMDNIWFCKLLLLFKIHTKTDTGMQYHECAYVSVFFCIWFCIQQHIVLHTAAYYLTYSAYSVYCNMRSMQNMNSALFFCTCFCIFCILICIQQHIIWHIQHILHISICKICRIWTLHYFLAYCFAYCAYCFAYICINMQNNMQTPKSICRIVQGSYFAYW